MTLSVCCQRLLLLAYCLSATLPAQKPRSSEAALANFTKVEDKPEADRRRAVRDLGPYAEPAVTELLLRELQTAKELGYRQDLVKAIGGSIRPLAVATLAPLLRRETNLYLQDLIAISIAKQGEEGIAVLTTELIAQRNNRSQRISLLNALGQSELRTARNAVLHELRTAAGRDRLPALRALKDVVGDVDIDELRVQLARDNDIEMACAALLQLDQHKHPMAGACALDLHKRGKPLDAQAHAAVLQGFLIKPIASTATHPFARRKGGRSIRQKGGTRMGGSACQRRSGTLPGQRCCRAKGSTSSCVSRRMPWPTRWRSRAHRTRQVIARTWSGKRCGSGRLGADRRSASPGVAHGTAKDRQR